MPMPIAEFTQGPRPNMTSDVLKVSQSTTDPNGIYIQLFKNYEGHKRIMTFKIDNIDDLITALQYAKFLRDG